MGFEEYVEDHLSYYVEYDGDPNYEQRLNWLNEEIKRTREQAEYLSSTGSVFDLKTAKRKYECILYLEEVRTDLLEEKWLAT